MDEYESLCHAKWECKYNVVIIPKCRRKALYGELRKYLGEVFRRLAEQKESRIEEGHLLPDHVHMMISIPPSTRYRRWWGLSKARVQYTWRGCTRKKAELCRSELLGTRLLCVHGGAG